MYTYSINNYNSTVKVYTIEENYSTADKPDVYAIDGVISNAEEYKKVKSSGNYTHTERGYADGQKFKHAFYRDNDNKPVTSGNLFPQPAADNDSSYDVAEYQPIEVVGYATVRKENATENAAELLERLQTISASEIKASDITTTQHSSLAEALQGKGKGESGNTVINVRGFGNPMYVIDGEKGTEADFKTLNPNTIESISVLKDASSDIYGPEAVKGIVVVTTKAPAKERKDQTADMSSTVVIKDAYHITASDVRESDVHAASTPAPKDDDSPFMRVEVMPKFQDGDIDTFRNWVQQRVRYPRIALDNGIVGRVTLKLIVEKDGSITVDQIISSPDATLSDEAKRVVESSPKWTPGQQRGQAVRVFFNLPVEFQVVKSNPPANSN